MYLSLYIYIYIYTYVPGVDDVRDVVDGDRGLRDVRRDDNLPLPRSRLRAYGIRFTRIR